jgi:hypothetical protein
MSVTRPIVWADVERLAVRIEELEADLNSARAEIDRAAHFERVCAELQDALLNMVTGILKGYTPRAMVYEAMDLLPGLEKELGAKR